VFEQQTAEKSMALRHRIFSAIRTQNFPGKTAACDGRYITMLSPSSLQSLGPAEPTALSWTR
jgi:hypothetical protein